MGLGTATATGRPWTWGQGRAYNAGFERPASVPDRPKGRTRCSRLSWAPVEGPARAAPVGDSPGRPKPRSGLEPQRAPAGRWLFAGPAGPTLDNYATGPRVTPRCPRCRPSRSASPGPELTTSRGKSQSRSLGRRVTSDSSRAAPRSRGVLQILVLHSRFDALAPSELDAWVPLELQRLLLYSCPETVGAARHR